MAISERMREIKRRRKRRKETQKQHIRDAQAAKAKKSK